MRKRLQIKGGRIKRTHAQSMVVAMLDDATITVNKVSEDTIVGAECVSEDV